MKSLAASVITGLILIPSATLSCSKDSFYCDDFESGTLSKANDSGFQWSSTNRTRVVRADGVITWKRSAPALESVAGSDWSAKSGRHTIQFYYPAGESMSEQRFSLNNPQRELWVRYWLRVPINFTHSTKEPSNNKLMAFWMDGYSQHGAGPTVAWEFWSDGKGGSRLALHYSEGESSRMGPHLQHFQFITAPTDRGRWMQIVARLRASSSPTASDGLLEFYRRWEGESEFVKYHFFKNVKLAIPKAGPAGWNAGYLMGWSNPTYARDTEWQIDDVEFSAKPLLGVLPNASSPAPDAPSGLSVEVK